MCIIHLNVIDPYADPYGDSMGWIRQFGLDNDLRVFREKGQKPIEPQRKMPILAAHNPEVVGSSPASATIKTTVFVMKTVVFLSSYRRRTHAGKAGPDQGQMWPGRVSGSQGQHIRQYEKSPEPLLRIGCIFARKGRLGQIFSGLFWGIFAKKAGSFDLR